MMIPLERQTVVRFKTTLQRSLNVSAGDSFCDLRKYKSRQLIDATLKKYPSTGGCLLQQGNIKYFHKNFNGKIHNFKKSTQTYKAIAHSGATSLPPFGAPFMNIEISQKNSSRKIFLVSFEKKYVIQLNIINVC